MKHRKKSPRKDTPTKRRPWTTQEDDAMAGLVRSERTLQWSSIAEQLRCGFDSPGRTGKQCRERWHNHLDPTISKMPWTLDEELTLFEGHRSLGNCWAEVSKMLPGRSDNAIKNRFYSTLKKQFRKLYGSDATRSDLKKYETELCSVILSNVHKKAKKLQKGSFTQSIEQFFGGPAEETVEPPDLPRLVPIEISELLVVGKAILLPEGAGEGWETSEFVEFERTEDPLKAGEILFMPV